MANSPWPDGGIFDDDENMLVDEDDNDSDEADDNAPVEAEALNEKYSPRMPQPRAIAPDHLVSMTDPTTKQVYVAQAAMVNGKKVLLERFRPASQAELFSVQKFGQPIGEAAPLPESTTWFQRNSTLVKVAVALAAAGGAYWWYTRREDKKVNGGSGGELPELEYEPDGHEQFESSVPEEDLVEDVM